MNISETSFFSKNRQKIVFLHKNKYEAVKNCDRVIKKNETRKNVNELKWNCKIPNCPIYVAIVKSKLRSSNPEGKNKNWFCQQQKKGITMEYGHKFPLFYFHLLIFSWKPADVEWIPNQIRHMPMVAYWTPMHTQCILNHSIHIRVE